MEFFHQILVKYTLRVWCNFFRYIMENKNFGLIYYANMEDAPLYELLRQSRIKTENQLMVFHDSICQDCPDTGRIAGAYIVLDQGGTFDHCTHITGPVSQSSAEIKYNSSFREGMALSHFMMLNNNFSNTDLYVVP